MKWPPIFGAPRRRKSSDQPISRLQRLSLHKTPEVTYAVGDVHGQLSLYRALEQRILEDAAAVDGPVLIVLLGDVVDRGPQSAQMIEHLLSPTPKGVTRVTLMGNHEYMFRRFLAAPDTARDWLSWGGVETLASYGVSGDPELGYNLSSRRLRKIMRACVPVSHRLFLENMPLSLELPEWIFAHAGIDPWRDFDEQGVAELLWGDPSRLDAGYDGRQVVHGHVIVDAPLITSARINVDTGAYRTGVLSAIRLESGEAPRVIDVRDD